MSDLPPLTASLVGILRGGPRKGAGLAADTGGAKTERHNVTLDASTVEAMRSLGAGNLSRGIREAARGLSGHAMREATIDRMAAYLAYDAECPCCLRGDVCEEGCTFADDAPQEFERMQMARAALGHCHFGGGDGMG